MANVSFDGTELSTLGLSVHELDGQGLAQWSSEKVRILGRDVTADLSGDFEAANTEISGVISAPIPPSPLYTRAGLLTNLDLLKDVLDPEKSFRKLIVTGDASPRYRWCRYAQMGFRGQRPIFKLPFTSISIGFDNLEPHWRVTHAPVTTAAMPFAVPNVGPKTRPVITFTCATAWTIASNIALFTMDGFTYTMVGIAAAVGDTIKIDAETLTVMRLPVNTTIWKDVVRGYRSTRFTDSGFPVLVKGGSTVTVKSSTISNLTFNYDELFR